MRGPSSSSRRLGLLSLAVFVFGAPQRTAAMGFSATESLANERQDFASTRLPDGSVLVCGGTGSNRLLSACERYDPLTEQWQAEGALNVARRFFTLTALNDGRVVAIGGEDLAGPLLTAEVYNTQTHTWTLSGPLSEARRNHAAVRLANGWVLVSGGQGANGELASAELWNPTRRDFRAGGTLATARAGHAAFVQTSGTVVVLGGRRSGAALASVERYNPAVNGWTEVGSLLVPRADFAAVAVDSERIFLCGGSDGTHQALASCELFDAIELASQPRAAMHVARRGLGLVHIQGELVWAVGGEGEAGPVRASSEVYNPSLDRWFATGLMSTPRSGVVAAMANDNRILVAAGAAASGPSASAELFFTGVGRWTPVNTALSQCASQNSALLADGRLLIAGGLQNCSAPVLYDRATDYWATSGPLTTLIGMHTLTALPDGRAVAMGTIYPNMTAVDKGEIYDPLQDTWSPIADLAQQRGGEFEATLMQNGRLLVTGGYRFADIAIAEAYDATFDSWWPAGTMLQGRRLHSGLLLADGRLLICGGIAGDYFAGTLRTLASCETFDPVAGHWSAGPQLNQARASYGLAVLGDGALLAAAGHNVRSAELLEAGSAAWRLTGATSGSSERVRAFRLPRGAVLLVSRSTSVGVYDPDTEAWWPTNDIGAHGPAGPLPTGEVMVGPQEFGVASIYSEGVPPVGLACDVDSECSPALCSVQGVCCDRRCSGTCESCTVAGAIGSCSVDPTCSPFDAGLPDRRRPDAVRPDGSRFDAGWPDGSVTDVLRPDAGPADLVGFDAQQPDVPGPDAVRTDVPRADRPRFDIVNRDRAAGDMAVDASSPWLDAGARDHSVAPDGPRRDAAGAFDLIAFEDAAGEDAALADAAGRERHRRGDAATDPIVVVNGGCECRTDAPATSTGLPLLLLAALALRRRRAP